MQQAHRDVDLYQSCAFRSQEKKKKKLAPGKKTDCILHVLLKMTVLENVFSKTKSETQVSTL